MSQVMSKYMVKSKPSDLEGLKSKRADLTPLELRVNGLNFQSQFSISRSEIVVSIHGLKV